MSRQMPRRCRLPSPAVAHKSKSDLSDLAIRLLPVLSQPIVGRTSRVEIYTRSNKVLDIAVIVLTVYRYKLETKTTLV